MSKPIRNYLLAVDNYRRPSRRRNTVGRYRVGAKTPEEAIALLREKIKFGSIQVLGEYSAPEGKVPYKTVVQEIAPIVDGMDITFTQAEPTGATEDYKSRWMREELALLKKSFPETFLLHNGEVVVHKKGNQYFNLANCESHQEVEYKVLEYFCRGAFKTEPYHRSDLNRQFHEYMRIGINDYLGTDFTEEDMELVYTHLGNGIHRELTKEFFNSNFDLNALTPQFIC